MNLKRNTLFINQGASEIAYVRLGVILVLVFLPALSCKTVPDGFYQEQLDFAEYYFGENEWEKAVPLYEAYLEQSPDQGLREEALFHLAVSLQGLGRWSEADRYLSECFYSFSQSETALEARERFGARIWRLEWGLYADWGQANQRIAELFDEDFEVERQPVRVNDDLLYAVRSGGYDTIAEAQAVVDNMVMRRDKPLIVAVAYDR
ncbi:MAG: hypothetical protein GY869_08890 [Planctomycetes bacterium]|nr:hypothetical protein [Planctomycetota bacterium]